ncbi:MAG: hypothetical protein AABN95_15975 [Acidobacteriota bacterium]
MYLIKPHRNLGFSRIETSNTSDVKRKEYEAEGYRSVNELEFEIARLVSAHNARTVVRIAQQLGGEMNEDGIELA